MQQFLRTFRLSLAVTAAVALLALFACFRGIAAKLPARPAFPINASTFVGDYAYIGSAGHYLFRYGFFGVREKIRQSDVLLLGSSHVEYGLSAGQLARDLSAAAGRPVRVYNLGLGYGESLAFDQTVLAANHVADKAAVIDLYSGHGDAISPYARKLDQLNDLGTFLALDNLWLQVADDWLLDPWLPRLTPGSAIDDPIHLTRMLGLMATRSWDNGDVTEFWAPGLGPIFTQPALGTLPPFDTVPHVTDPNVSAASRHIIEAYRLRPVFTKVPWADVYSATLLPPVQPFIDISPEGLSFFDTAHLTSDSRQVATGRLFDGIKSAGVLDGWLGKGAARAAPAEGK